MEYRTLWLIVCSGYFTVSLATSDADVITTEICMVEEFQPSCPLGHVVIIESAHFGRMQQGRCITSTENLKCFADVKQFVESQCAGRRTCILPVPSKPLQDSPHGCSSDRVGYLEVSYRCLAVYTSNAECTSGVLSVNSSSGYLASSITRETNKGSQACPWKIQVASGRTLSLTLFDYGSSLDSANESLQVGQESKCYIYAKIVDKSTPGTSVLKCGGDEGRIRRVYSSTSNLIHVIFGHVNNANFLIKFEAEGCSDIKVPDSGEVKRTGNKLQVQCSPSEETWEAACVNDQWVPDRNCSALVAASQVGPSTHKDVSNGTVVLLVAGVALFISLAIIAFGIVFLRCRSKSRLSGTSVRPLDSYKYSVPVYYDGSKELYPMLANQERMSVDWDRDYATTLQMRHSIPPSSPRHRLVSDQDVWCCPVHGPVASPFSTVDRRRINSTNDHGPLRSSFSTADRRRINSNNDHGPLGSPFSTVDRRRIHSTGDPTYEIPHLNPSLLVDLQNNSPFYHELDPRALQQLNAIREAELAAAAAARMAVSAAAACAANSSAAALCSAVTSSTASTPSASASKPTTSIATEEVSSTNAAISAPLTEQTTAATSSSPNASSDPLATAFISDPIGVNLPNSSSPDSIGIIISDPSSPDSFGKNLPNSTPDSLSDTGESLDNASLCSRSGTTEIAQTDLMLI